MATKRKGIFFPICLDRIIDSLSNEDCGLLLKEMFAGISEEVDFPEELSDAALVAVITVRDVCNVKCNEMQRYATDETLHSLHVTEGENGND